MSRMTTNQFLQNLVGLSSYFRYAALYRNGELEAVERAGLPQTTSPESDRYEELIVNPTLQGRKLAALSLVLAGHVQAAGEGARLVAGFQKLPSR